MSLARKQRRGKVDQFGNKIPKRLYNNKKRTKGRQKQASLQHHYSELRRRIKYIKWLGDTLRENKEMLTSLNWIKTVRKYDKEELIFDDYEKEILFKLVNV